MEYFHCPVSHVQGCTFMNIEWSWFIFKDELSEMSLYINDG
jgi:hypothetical protein